MEVEEEEEEEEEGLSKASVPWEGELCTHTISPPRCCYGLSDSKSIGNRGRLFPLKF